MKNWIIGILFLLQAGTAIADDQVLSGVRSQLQALGASKDSSFCYVVEGGEVRGINADQPVRIASVMKTMTTFWAIETLGGPNARLTTKVYYRQATGEMHIAGSNDPFFTRDRFYLLLSDLNRLGIKSVDRLTVDTNFRMNVELFNSPFNHSEEHADHTLSKMTKEELLELFNSSNWWGARAGYYANLRKNSSDPQFVPKLSFAVSRTNVLDHNPLAGQPGVMTFELKSAPIKTYLKKMNILSINPVADELFFALGGKAGFQKFLSEKYKMANSADDVETGSGLPVFRAGRDDTSMSCADVVRVIRRMDLDLEQKYNTDLADVMMISGVDTEPGATFSDGSQSLIVKTGTLTANGSVAKNLAGSMKTTEGEVYFGIFMNGRGANSGGVRSVLARLMSKYDKVAIKRSSFRFDQLDSEMQLRQTAVSMNRG